MYRRYTVSEEWRYERMAFVREKRKSYIRITPTFYIFDFNIAYAAHKIYCAYYREIVLCKFR